MPTSMQRVLVWSELHHPTKSSTSWEDFGSQTDEARTQQAKRVSAKGMSWATLHTSKHSRFMGNYQPLISSLEPSSPRDGLSSTVRVKPCKLIMDKAMNNITKSRKRKRNASKTTRGVRTAATWHHKSHCHSKDNQLLLKNSAIERPSQSRNKSLSQV